MHETTWKSKTTRKTPPTRHRVVKKRFNCVGCRPEDRLFSQLGNSLEGSSSSLWIKVSGIQEGSWTSLKTDLPTTTILDSDSGKRTSVLWIFNRPLDNQKGSRGDKRTLRYSIPSQSHVEVFNESWVELSETGNKSPGKRRSQNCSLETLCLATYKKTPQGLAPIWLSLMNPGFCWFLQSAGHGHPKEKPLYLKLLVVGTRFRPFLQLVSPPKENDWLSMQDFILIKTSLLCRWKNFWRIFCDISMGRSFFFGIEAERIVPKILCSFVNATGDFNLISFQAMRQNLIQTNLFGICLKELWPTVFQKISDILKSSFVSLCRDSDLRKNFFGHVFMLRSCHGHKLSIIYA